MAIHTIESPNTIPRLSNQLVFADTSHAFAVTDPNDKWRHIAEPFHEKALNNGIVFIINVVVRQEFVKRIRSGLLAQKLIKLAVADTFLRTEYARELGTNPKVRKLHPSGLPENLANQIRSGTEKLFKWHIRNNTTARVLEGTDFDVWSEAEDLLRFASITYQSGKKSLSWLDLGQIITATGMAPTDAMIANFALNASAVGIIAMDCDYIQVADQIDVYLPKSEAEKCVNYDPSLD